jgi:hypothetical protein
VNVIALPSRPCRRSIIPPPFFPRRTAPLLLPSLPHICKDVVSPRFGVVAPVPELKRDASRCPRVAGRHLMQPLLTAVDGCLHSPSTSSTTTSIDRGEVALNTYRGEGDEAARAMQCRATDVAKPRRRRSRCYYWVAIATWVSISLLSSPLLATAWTVPQPEPQALLQPILSALPSYISH